METKGTMDQALQLTLMRELAQHPPAWFDNVLAYCRVDRLQRKDILLRLSCQSMKNSTPGRDIVPASSSTYNVAYIARAIRCGLLQPILCSAAETGDLHLVDALKDASQLNPTTAPSFPWLFLAYLGAQNGKLQLVERCVFNIIKGLGQFGLGIQYNSNKEVGLAYRVWRYLLEEGKYDEESSAGRALLGLFQASADKRQDWTFVHLAAAYGDEDCLRILLDHPCNQNYDMLNAATELEGFTALHLAAWNGHAATVRLLLKHADAYPSGIADDIIPKDRLFGRSPLHHASVSGQIEVVSMLVEKWGSLGVDLQDRYGITALHLAAYVADIPVVECLIRKAEQPNQRVEKDFALQSSTLMARFFVERRTYINETATSRIFIPTPPMIRAFDVWTAQGATALHCAAARENEELLMAFLNHSKGTAVLDWGAEDSAGLSPVDYANSYVALIRGFLQKDEARKVDSLAKALGKCTLETQDKAISKMAEGARALNRVWNLNFIYSLDRYLLSGDYSVAREHSIEYWSKRVERRFFTDEFRMTVDDDAWDHVEWAFNEALHSHDADNLRLPRLHAADAEEMMVTLVRNKALRGKCTLQRCLQWAIDKRMEMLAEELVNDPDCELVSVVPGCEHKESPLAKVSRSRVAKQMPRLVAAMELREDVKRRWYEDRQVYVDYANALLVGAVLIAGLAFTGWLQPPRGYVDGMGVMDMERRAVRVFVWSSSASFFLAMATLLAGAAGAMPFAIGSGRLVSGRGKVMRATLAASLFLAASISCLALAFSFAALAVLPQAHSLTLTCLHGLGGLFMSCMLIWFLKRLHHLWSLAQYR